MKTLLIIMLVGIVTNVVGAVILIQLGGWLPILVAILSLLFTMLLSSIITIVTGDSVKRQVNRMQKFEKEIVKEET
jgi:O-antigen/teichoic acid export membrane protein